MPSLPSANLTLHLDASDSDHLFTTYVSGGPNTGTPSDGSTIQAWNDESLSRIAKQSGAGNLPVWRSSTPLLPYPCLDFASASSQLMAVTGTTGTLVPSSTLISASAFTVLISFWAESIAGSSTQPWSNEALLLDIGQYWGVSLKNNGGSYSVQAYNWDGANKNVSKTITLATKHVVMARHEGGNLYISIDGGSESSVASGNTASLVDGVRIGRSGLFYDGRIGEIAVYNAALTGTNLSDAVAYFVDKWITGPPVGSPVPNVVGSTEAAASAAIVGAGFLVGDITYAHDAVVVSGSVISQSPLAGVVTPLGSEVDIVVSLGPTIPGSITQVAVEVAADLGSGATMGLSGLPVEVSARNSTATQVGLSGLPVEVQTVLFTADGLTVIFSGVPVEILMGVEAQLPPVEPYPGPELPPVEPAPSTLNATLLVMRRLRRFAFVTEDDYRVFIRRLEFYLDTGVGITGIEAVGSTPQVMLRWSDDGGMTWGNEHWASAGRAGEFSLRVVFNRLGWSYDRIFELVVSDPVAWRFVQAFIQATPGRS